MTVDEQLKHAEEICETHIRSAVATASSAASALGIDVRVFALALAYDQLNSAVAAVGALYNADDELVAQSIGIETVQEILNEIREAGSAS